METLGTALCFLASARCFRNGSLPKSSSILALQSFVVARTRLALVTYLYGDTCWATRGVVLATRTRRTRGTGTAHSGSLSTTFGKSPSFSKRILSGKLHDFHLLLERLHCSLSARPSVRESATRAFSTTVSRPFSNQRFCALDHELLVRYRIVF